MNPLELLKKDWKNREGEFKQYSKAQLGMMLHRRSSNIVKWIFLIGLAEFAFWLLLRLLMPKDNYELFEDLHLTTGLHVFEILNYIVIFGFLFYFYKNFRSISVYEDTYTLMQRILRTRQTVKIYVYYNLIMMFLSFLVINLVIYYHPDSLMTFFEKKYSQLPDQEKFIKAFMISQAVIAVVFLLLLWGFYRLIYGILLKKLKRNYKDLQKLVD